MANKSGHPHALQSQRHTTITDHWNLAGKLTEVHFRITTTASKSVPVSGHASSAVIGDYQIETCPVDDMDVLVGIRQWP